MASPLLALFFSLTLAAFSPPSTFAHAHLHHTFNLSQPSLNFSIDPLPLPPSVNTSFLRRDLRGYGRSANTIDNCWREDPTWARNRKRLADCAIGFGSKTTGGKGGRFYIVTDPSDDPINPRPGTLRYGAIQLVPLWIYFARDMTIILKNELIVTSDKTIDGRGAAVHIAYGPCFTLQYVNNVIIHGLHIHDCKPGSKGDVRSSIAHLGYRGGSDGDGISIFGSKNIWIDHNSLSSCYDGLIDVIHASTAITISNNEFTNHDEVMLLGHSDAYTADKAMRVTVAFNRFGPGLVQRMPRCRFGYFHVVNNDYYGWSKYAVGGSADPTIISEGNRYLASDAKQVTKRESSGGWSGWTWRSMDDTFLDGAYFVESGHEVKGYGLASSSKFLPSMTMDAGALACVRDCPC